MYRFTDQQDHPLATQFTAMIGDAQFPCVGAKAALNRGGVRFVIARDFSSAWDDLRIHAALLAVVRDYRVDPVPFQSLAVLFEHGAPDDEQAFENGLWQRLQSLTDKDDWFGQRPDPRVGVDPGEPHFAVSFGGEGFFVVGLHPRSSRPARRAPVAAMIFNLHDQFEKLREAGRYEPLRAAIIDRDIRFAGSANPMLSRHGSQSAARQYSGRAVGDEWRCPFARGSTAPEDAVVGE